MAGKHYELTSIHQAAYVTDTDPSIDPDNHVTAGKFWVDTTSGESTAVLKYRNAANSAWIDLLGGTSTPTGAILAGADTIDVGGDTLVTGA